MTSNRLNPENKGNARLLYIDGDALSCDICDEKREGAVLDTIGGGHSTTLRICKKCLEAILGRFKIPRRPRINDEDRRTLTGRELRIAGEKHLPVFYIEVHSGYDSHMDYHKKCHMKKANEGYYIGNSDIMPDIFEDSEEVSGDDGDGTTYRVCAVEGVKYE